MHTDYNQIKTVQETLSLEFSNNVFFYHEQASSGIPFDKKIAEALNVFLKLHICRSLSLFLLEAESFEFRHRLSLPKTTGKYPEELFARLIENGLIAKSINTGDITFSVRTAEVNDENVLVVPLVNFSGVAGVIIIELNIPACEIEFRLLNHFKMYAGHLAAEIKLNAVQYELSNIKTSFENEFNRNVSSLFQSKMEIMKILDSLQTGIFIIDQNSNQIQDANLVALKMLGIPKQLVIGTDRSRYCACTCRETETADGLCTNAGFRECSIMDSNGTLYYIIRKVLPIKLGDEEEYYLESFMDITERRIAELELQKLKEELEKRVVERTESLNFSNELLRNEIEENKKLFMAVEQSPVAILISDAGWCTEYVNSAFSKLTGYSYSETLGNMPPLLKDDITELSLQKELVEVIVEGREWKKEVLSRKKDGREFWSVVTVSALRDDAGKLTHYIFMQEDISERKTMQDNLSKAKEKAESSAKIKSEFLSLMSHEIRTPVNTMLNFASLLKMELKEHLTPENESGFNMITNGGLRLIRTVDMILSMADLQTESYEPRFENIDLHADIIAGNMGEFESIAKVKGIELNYSNAAQSAVIRADGQSVLRIFINLLDNAVKFTSRGSIDVQLCNDAEKNVILKVSDTGVGISDEFIPQLFTPFSQEDAGFTRKFEGNGLGLALVKKYCELNGAEIDVVSEKKKGSTFVVTFKNTLANGGDLQGPGLKEGFPNVKTRHRKRK